MTEENLRTGFELNPVTERQGRQLRVVSRDNLDLDFGALVEMMNNRTVEAAQENQRLAQQARNL